MEEKILKVGDRVRINAITALALGFPAMRW